MRSSRRQRNLPPEASATMENVGGRLSHSASNARPIPSPLALSLPLFLPPSSLHPSLPSSLPPSQSYIVECHFLSLHIVLTLPHFANQFFHVHHQLQTPQSSVITATDTGRSIDQRRNRYYNYVVSEMYHFTTFCAVWEHAQS